MTVASERWQRSASVSSRRQPAVTLEGVFHNDVSGRAVLIPELVRSRCGSTQVEQARCSRAAERAAHGTRGFTPR
jgi:hypothetical protein